MKIFGKIGVILLTLVVFSFAKEKIKTPEVTADELKKHISYLASEALKGRRTGTEGDSLAADYIRMELKDDGLKALFANGFERFRVTDKIIYGPSNSLVVNGTSLKPEVDFAPFAFSENTSFKGDVVFGGYGFEIDEDSLKWHDYAGIDVKGKVVLILRADPDIEKNSSPFIKYSHDRDKVLQANYRYGYVVMTANPWINLNHWPEETNQLEFPHSESQGKSLIQF